MNKYIKRMLTVGGVVLSLMTVMGCDYRPHPVIVPVHPDIIPEPRPVPVIVPPCGPSYYPHRRHHHHRHHWHPHRSYSRPIYESRSFSTPAYPVQSMSGSSENFD